jgi:hypothetical protein
MTDEQKQYTAALEAALAEVPVSYKPSEVALSNTEREIIQVCDDLKAMLLMKNRAYGDSALSPMRVFSRADTVEQLKVRLDDKLSRLMRGGALPDESMEDTVFDLMGYLVLLRVATKRRLAAALGTRL